MIDLALAKPLSLDALANSLDLDPAERDAAVADFTLGNLYSSGSSSDSDTLYSSPLTRPRTISFRAAESEWSPPNRSVSFRTDDSPTRLQRHASLHQRRINFDPYVALPAVGGAALALAPPAKTMTRTKTLAASEVIDAYRKEDAAFGAMLQEERRRKEVRGHFKGRFRRRFHLL